MKPTLTLRNEWKWLRNGAAEFTPIYLNFDWCRGNFYYVTFRILGVGFCAGCYKAGKQADQFAADDVPHPFADPDALTGNITSPIGAHSFEAIKEAHEDSPQAMNWVDQSRDGS